MQAIGHGRRFAGAALAATRAEAAEGGAVASYRRGILDRRHLARPRIGAARREALPCLCAE